MTFEKLLAAVPAANLQAQKDAVARWDAIAKPLHSLGLLEDAIVRIAGITGTPEVRFGKKAVVVMCADNGVVAQGVTQTGQEVTAIVAENMTTGDTSVCRMASVAGATVIPVDMGCSRPLNDKVLNRCIRRGGTRDMAVEPAMTRQECIQAILAGAELVFDLQKQGYGLIATGEMGIGNTTTSSAMASVLLDQPVSVVTGRGAGLSGEGLQRKIAVIEQAIALHRPNPKDPMCVLSKVGGLDIVGLVGVFLGCAACGVPVLLDGFISGVAALTAARMCPNAKDAMLASHVSKEPAGQLVLDALGLKPLLHGEMCLGEGTGAVAVMPLLDMGLAVYSGMTTFSAINIESYVPLN